MKLIVDLAPYSGSFEDYAESFFDILRALEASSLFVSSWHGLGVRLWDDPDGFVGATRDWYIQWTQNLPDREFSGGVLNDAGREEASTSVDLSVGERNTRGNILSVELLRPHPTLTYDARLFAGVCEIILDWRPVQHMSLAWPGYRRELQPLDAHRRGLGWLGWVPFDIAPAQIPEAQICRPMRDGTFIGLQNDLWFSHGPNADPDAVRRAQALEHRLNRLGVLPTFEELKRGDWGRS